MSTFQTFAAPGYKFNTAADLSRIETRGAFEPVGDRRILRHY